MWRYLTQEFMQRDEISTWTSSQDALFCVLLWSLLEHLSLWVWFHSPLSLTQWPTTWSEVTSELTLPVYQGLNLKLPGGCWASTLVRMGSLQVWNSCTSELFYSHIWFFLAEHLLPDTRDLLRQLGHMCSEGGGRFFDFSFFLALWNIVCWVDSFLFYK